MPEMSVDMEAIALALADEMSSHNEYPVTEVSDVDEDARTCGYFFDFTGKDGHTYFVLVGERDQ